MFHSSPSGPNDHAWWFRHPECPCWVRRSTCLAAEMRYCNKRLADAGLCNGAVWKTIRGTDVLLRLQGSIVFNTTNTTGFCWRWTCTIFCNAKRTWPKKHKRSRHAHHETIFSCYIWRRSRQPKWDGSRKKQKLCVLPGFMALQRKKHRK